MAIVADPVGIPNDGIIADLECYRANWLNPGALRLFTNNFTPGHTSVVGDFVEASFVGYVPDLTPTFGAVYINGSLQAETDSVPYTFMFTAGVGSATVYGWYITDASGTKVLAYCKFATPFVISLLNPLVIQAQVVCFSQF